MATAGIAPAVVAGLSFGAVLLVVLELRTARLRRLCAHPQDIGTPVVDIADVADLLALVLTSGRGVTDSLAAVADAMGGRLGADLRIVVAARAWGVADDAAWRLVDPAWQPLARALLLADVAGVPPSSTLTSVAADVRRAEAYRFEVATERLGVRLVLPLGLCFLPAFVATTVVPVVMALASGVLAG